ncbi:class I SAM-dependent methyltransferase [Candidatus Hydrogenedentota bacterium]
MHIRDIEAKFRSPIRADYPELEGYTRDEIHEDNMGVGVLFMAAKMSRAMGLKEDDIVMDLGCGKGATAAFLAKHFGVQIVAVDLWNSPTFLSNKFEQRGYRGKILPLQLDVTEKLPFAEDYFDAVFCMCSFHYYGGSVEFLGHLVKHIKPGGILCVGNPCFNQEFTPEQLENLPHVYDDGTDVWENEFSRYHSPGWWENLFEDSGVLEVLECFEVGDGVVMWEDDLLMDIRKGFPDADKERDAAQIAYRYDNAPYLTHFIITARKR